MRNGMRLKHYMYVDRSHMFISFKMVIKVVRKLFLSFHFGKTLCPEIHFDFTEMVTARTLLRLNISQFNFKDLRSAKGQFFLFFN